MVQKCPTCKESKRVWSKGWRYNASGKKQMFWCNACKKRFTPDDGFWKMKHTPEIVTEACSSYKRGMSLKNVKDHLSDFRETDISRTSVLNWIKKYSVLLENTTGKLTPKIKGSLHNDEFFVHVKKN
jgi:transposase-like protein